ncbi:MAG: hypothetical protein OEZ24_07135 [Candidatus Bathyarchaeota archaeon]|nr:hypothetical protein [Candidatus Bathyarchaeota archaeon]
MPEDIPPLGTPSNGAIRGRNRFGKIGYGSPCPRSATRHHVYTLCELWELRRMQNMTRRGVI